jgi:dihydroorotase
VPIETLEPPNTHFDLLVRNGTLVDPSQGLHGKHDVGIIGGRVAAIAPQLAGTTDRVLDASGSLVTPGLVDLHAHVWTGVTSLGIEADAYCLARGVTTVVDAGSAGAITFPGFARYVVQQVRTRTLAFLNISAMGLIDDEMGELLDLRWAMVGRAVEIASANRETVVGIKVRLSQMLVGNNGVAALDRALEAAEAIGCPLMVHIGGTEQPVGAILDRLRSGDILTHAYTGWKPGILDEAGHVIAEAIAARARGVLFDVGHGQGSFTFTSAEGALENGFPPDTISTDLHRANVDGPVFDLVTTLSKFLCLGLELDAVIAMATYRPAAAIGRTAEFGSLRPGMTADLSLLRLVDGPVTFVDSSGAQRRGDRRLRSVGAVRAGRSI